MSKSVLECPPHGCYHSPGTRRVEGESPTPQGASKTSPQTVATAGAGIGQSPPPSGGQKSSLVSGFPVHLHAWRKGPDRGEMPYCRRCPYHKKTIPHLLSQECFTIPIPQGTIRTHHYCDKAIPGVYPGWCKLYDGHRRPK